MGTLELIPNIVARKLKGKAVAFTTTLTAALTTRIVVTHQSVPVGATLTPALATSLTVGHSFIPPDIAGMVAWYDFSDIRKLWTDTARTTQVTADGQTIGGVTDAWLGTNHLRQTGGASRPTYKTGIQNGLSAASFDGGDSWEVITSPNYAQPNTIFIVGKHGTGLVGSGTNFFSGSATGHNVIGIGTGNHWKLNAGTVLGGALTSDTANHIFCGQLNGASSKLWVDGGTADIAANAGAESLGNGVANGMHIASGDAGTDRLPAASYVYEVVVYNAALSLANINTLGSYFNTKWGITWTTAV